MKLVTKLMTKHRVRVLSYLEVKKPASKPSLKWWVVFLSVHGVATVLSSLFTHLQVISTLLIQQDAEFTSLCVNLSEMCTVDGPLSDQTISNLFS